MCLTARVQRMIAISSGFRRQARLRHHLFEQALVKTFFMFYSSKISPDWGKRTAILLLLVLGILRLPAQMVDLNGNGMSDVWENRYNAAGPLAPNADPDGDHFCNLQEALAGTDPFDSNSLPQITLVTMVGTNVVLIAPGQLGKKYTLQWRILFGVGASTNWTE